MKETIINGTGNSRYLKTSLPAGTTWEAALAMLRAGTFPIDLFGINPSGIQQLGDALNKSNLLKDATAAFCGLGPEAVPDTVYKALQSQLFGVNGTKGLIKITLLTPSGTPIPNGEVTVSGGTAGKKYITDVNGVVYADTSTTSTTISFGGAYADMNTATQTISTPLGAITATTLTASFKEFMKFTASTTVRLSPYCKKLHVTAVGGGGGGGGVYAYNGGGGGGGGYCTVAYNVAFTPNTDMPVVVGAGGSGNTTGSSSGNGSAGGSSSFAGVSASGGNGGSGVNGYGGYGNGNGGTGATPSVAATAAGAGTTAGFSSATATVYYGGGGGGAGGYGGGSYYGRGSAAGYGGIGGYSGDDAQPGTDGFGGGGGGGAFHNGGSGDRYGFSGKNGGSGCVAIRMEH